MCKIAHRNAPSSSETTCAVDLSTASLPRIAACLCRATSFPSPAVRGRVCRRGQEGVPGAEARSAGHDSASFRTKLNRSKDICLSSCIVRVRQHASTRGRRTADSTLIQKTLHCARTHTTQYSWNILLNALCPETRPYIHINFVPGI